MTNTNETAADKIRRCFVEEATRMVEEMRRTGYGIGSDGKGRDGAPARVNPSRVAEAVRDAAEMIGLRLVNADYRAVEDALRAAGWKSAYIGTKRFFALTEDEAGSAVSARFDGDAGFVELARGGWRGRCRSGKEKVFPSKEEAKTWVREEWTAFRARRVERAQARRAAR